MQINASKRDAGKNNLDVCVQLFNGGQIGSDLMRWRVQKEGGYIESVQNTVDGNWGTVYIVPTTQ